MFEQKAASTKAGSQHQEAQVCREEDDGKPKIQDELVGRQRDMKVMEWRLEEYSAIIHTFEDTISSMTPPTIAKQWVKSKDKKWGHMEWTAGCNKLVIELLANRDPPSSIQASILAMARSFFRGHDIVREQPCLKRIRI